MLICLDAGHYLGTPGKRCLKSIDPGETREWVLNSRAADKVQQRLAAYDCQTMRVDDVTGAEEVTLYERVRAANRAGADLYLSIHHNAGIKGGSGGGIVVYVCNGVGEDTTSVQKAVYEATVAATGLRGNRSTPLAVKDYYVLVNTTMPAVLGEFGFMDSTTDTPIILTEEYADQLAEGIVAALVDLYNLQPVKTETGPVEYHAGDFHEFAVPVDLFSIEAVDAAKNSLERNYTNGGYFGNFAENGEKFTLPSGPIVADMKTDSKWVNHYAQERDWLDGDKIRYNSYFWAYKNPFYQKAVSCLMVSGGKVEIKEVEELPECDYLVSGIPVIRDGKKVKKGDALAQGWDNSSMRATSHIFVGLNGDGKIHIIGGKTTTSDMSDAADKLLKAGYTDVIKLDGGGSYEVNTDVVTASTSEDRRIFSVLRMKGDIIMAGADVKDAEYEKWKGYMERWEAEKAALPASSWAVPYIAKAIDAGVMADVGGTIERPQAKVTREELATVAAALAEKK